MKASQNLPDYYCLRIKILSLNRFRFANGEAEELNLEDYH